MSVFKKLFAKQAGGSIVGNILRGVGDRYTGGAFSQIFKRPKGDPATNVDNVVNTITANAKTPSGAASTTQPTGGESGGGFKETLKKYWWAFAGGAVALVAGIWFVTSRGSGKGRGKRSW